MKKREERRCVRVCERERGGGGRRESWFFQRVKARDMLETNKSRLNLSHKKPASMVATHINNKWRQVVPVGFELRVYPMPGAENAVNGGWGQEHNKVSMGKLFAALNCTTELQLHYDIAEVAANPLLALSCLLD